MRPSRAEHTSEDGGVEPWWDKVENKHAKCLGRSWGNVLLGDKIRPGGRSIYQDGVQQCKVLRSILEEFRPRGRSIYQDRELTCKVLGFDLEVDHILVVNYDMEVTHARRSSSSSFRVICHTCKVVRSVRRAMWST